MTDRETDSETERFIKVLERATCASFRAEGIPFDESELPALKKIVDKINEKRGRE